jgi:DHA1 family florfenicol/chloramphenicol resistance protein-like MFS transporter
MYLPVIPHMADALRTGTGTIQLTLTVYLILLGAGQLVFGPLSDRFGRRPVLLGGGVAYLAASFMLAVTSSADVFLACRIIQASGASACIVAIFAMVRDIYSGRQESNVIYGLLGAILATVPAVGPLLGTLVNTLMGWRAIFGLLGCLMAVAVIVIWTICPETRRKQTADLYWAQLFLPVKQLNFWLYTLCYSAGMGSFFVFLSIAPWVMTGRQGLSQLSFSLLFASVAIAMMVASRMAGSWIVRWGLLNMLRAGMGCLIAGALLLVVGEIFAPESVVGFIGPMWLISVGISIAGSVAPNGALRGFDHIAGTATAIYFCLGSVLLGVIGTLIITLLSNTTLSNTMLSNTTVWPIIVYSLMLATIVLCLSCLVKARE